jgi:membrane protease YdiL (CAAX protease family)
VGAVSVISLVIFVLYILGYYNIFSINMRIFNMAYFLIIITSLAAFEEILFRGIGFRIVEERIP